MILKADELKQGPESIIIRNLYYKTANALSIISKITDYPKTIENLKEYLKIQKPEVASQYEALVDYLEAAEDTIEPEKSEVAAAAEVKKTPKQDTTSSLENEWNAFLINTNQIPESLIPEDHQIALDTLKAVIKATPNGFFDQYITKYENLIFHLISNLHRTKIQKSDITNILDLLLNSKLENKNAMIAELFKKTPVVTKPHFIAVLTTHSNGKIDERLKDCCMDEVKRYQDRPLLKPSIQTEIAQLKQTQ